MTAFEHACRTIRGARRYQEDSAVLWPGSATYGEGALRPDARPGELLAVLADGMGGHAGGALASRSACELFLDSFTISAPSDAQDADARFAHLRNRLLEGVLKANDGIADIVDGDPTLNGMGTTLVAAVLDQSGLSWVSIGDSPLYLYRGGELALLNEDHSLAPALDQMVAEGQLTAEEARSDPRRHMLRSAITGDELDLVDVARKPLELAPGDLILLASDGLHTLEHGEIERIMRGYAADGPGAVGDALLRAVEQVRDPHQDNTTLIVVSPKL